MLTVDDQKIVLADVPGLIEGAHLNRGLGHYFLRHIERTRVILHVLDLSSDDPQEVIGQWKTLMEEFRQYNADLTRRPYMVVLNKVDLLRQRSTASEVEAFFALQKVPVATTSALFSEGVQELIKRIVEVVRQNPRPQGSYRLFDLPQELENPSREKPRIVLEESGVYRVIHRRIEAASARYDFGQEEAAVRFMRILRQFRVEEMLEDAGAQEGDTVHIGDVSFTFEPERSC